MSVHDRHGRALGTLRLSVTDRCNLRCIYCMPENDYVWLLHESILSAEELERVARAFASLGASEVRITGGEPLLRPELEEIVERVARIEGVRDIALTTNGVLFAPRAEKLARAGLSRVTFSVDTLRADRAKAMSRTTRLADVLDGVRAARDAGFRRTKINAVVVRGKNDDELLELCAFARENGAEMRFIEYMDVGGATQWRASDVVTRAEILAALGDPDPIGDDEGAPAARHRMRDGTIVGIIASTTAPFCARCDRARVTADGVYFGCLYAESGVDLRSALRSGASTEEVARIVRAAWEAREDRGAERRRATEARGAFVPVERLRADPHREMHTRGG